MMGLVSMPRWAARLVSAAAIAMLAGGSVAVGIVGGASAAAATAHPVAAAAVPANAVPANVVPANVVPANVVPANVVPARVATPRTALLWHTMPLINGWHSASAKGLVTGTPAWARSNGMVYFRGAISQFVTGTGDVVAELPQVAWPASNLYLNVYTSGDVAGVLFISTTGEVRAYFGNATTFTSLAGVSYPETTMASHSLTLENGWVSSQSQWGTGNPAYNVSGGVVYLSGSLRSSGTQHLAAVLPKAARPAQTLYVQAYTYGGATGWVEILPNGNVAPFGVRAKTYTSLAGISFPVAATKWKTFSLEDEWTSGQAKFHTSAPEYTILNGVVYLNGSMYQAKPSNGLWTTLPSGVKTGGDVLELEADASNGAAGLVTVTNSLGLAGSVPFKNSEAFLSLAGIAYPWGS